MAGGVSAADEETDALLDATLNRARKVIDGGGEFSPFALTVDQEGHINSATPLRHDENANSARLADLLNAPLREQGRRGEIRGYALCFGVRIPTEDETAISVTITHAHAEPVHVLIPYRRNPVGAVTYGELRTAKGTHWIFAERPGR